MPVLQPAEPWKRTGRYGIEELFKLKDRKGADMVLALTHEEIVTTHVAAAVKSYRDLPLILYHFQTKERDEARPRAGVLRTREFIMKDSYTFDRDAEGLDAQYQKHVQRLRPDVRSVRARVVPGRVRRRDDGGHRRARVHGALPGRGERRGAGAGLRGQPRGGERGGATGGARAASRPARARAHARDDHDRRGRHRPRRAGRAPCSRPIRSCLAATRCGWWCSGAIIGSTRSSCRTRSGRRFARPIPTRWPRASVRPATSARLARRCRSCSTPRSPRAATSRAPISRTPTCGGSSRAAISRSSGSMSAPWSPATP